MNIDLKQIKGREINSHHPLGKPKCQDSLLLCTFPSIFITQSDKLNHLFCLRRCRCWALTSLFACQCVLWPFPNSIFFSVRVDNNELIHDFICIIRLISILFKNLWTFSIVQLEILPNLIESSIRKRKKNLCNHLSNKQQFYSLQIIRNKITPLFQLNIEHFLWINNSN